MASRFNQLIEPNKYVSQYVPLPLDFINQQGAAMQKESDTNKKALADSVLENIKSISEHDPYRNKYVQGFNDQAKSLLDDPNFDFASAEGKAKAYNLIRQHAEDPNLQIIARSIDNKKQTLEDLEAIKKEKDAYGEWNDPTKQDEKLQSLGINPYLNEDGTPKEYERKTILRAENHNEPVYALFDKMKDDSDVQAWANFTGDKTAITTGKKGWEGITPEKVEIIANNNIGTFKETAGGQDFLRKLHYDYAQQFNKMDPSTAQKAEDEAVKQHLVSLGSAYVHGKKIAEAGLSATSLLGIKYAEDQANQTTTTQSEGIKNNASQEVDYLNNLEFDKDGNLKPIKKGGWVPDPYAVDENGVKDPNAVKYVENDTVDTDAVRKAFDKIYQIKKDNPKLAGLSNQAAVEAYKKARQSLSNESVPLNSISNVAAKGIGESLARNLQQRNVYLYDGSGVTEDGQVSTVLSKLGITQEALNKAIEGGIGGFTQASPGKGKNGETAGSYYVQVPDSNGINRRVLVSADTEIADIFSASQKINDVRKTMKRGQVEDQGHIITIEPDVKADGTTDWKYTVEKRNDDGTTSVEIIPDLLTKVREREKEALKKSNFLGRQIEVQKPNTAQ